MRKGLFSCLFDHFLLHFADVFNDEGLCFYVIRLKVKVAFEHEWKNAGLVNVDGIIGFIQYKGIIFVYLSFYYSHVFNYIF